MKTLLLYTLIAFQLPDYYSLNPKAFFMLPEVNQRIDAQNINEKLLDAAIFQATNQYRIQHTLPLFLYKNTLHGSARGHSEDMIRLDFYDHTNRRNPAKTTPDKRMAAQDATLMGMAENIAQFDLLDNPSHTYCFDNKPNAQGYYEFFDCKTRRKFDTHTYASFAKMVVEGWMNSPPHRANIVNARLTHLGCAAKLSKNPMVDKIAPFFRLTQNFGAY